MVSKGFYKFTVCVVLLRKSKHAEALEELREQERRCAEALLKQEESGWETNPYTI